MKASTIITMLGECIEILDTETPDALPTTDYIERVRKARKYLERMRRLVDDYRASDYNETLKRAIASQKEFERSEK